MGFMTFAVARIADLFLPGSGILLDSLEALEVVDVLLTAGDFSREAAKDAKADVMRYHKSGRKVPASVITRHVRRCGICRREGHNRRTCPRASCDD